MITSKYLNAVLTVIAVLMGLNLWADAHQSRSSVSGLIDPATPAHAAPVNRIDAAQQRTAMIQELKNLAGKADAISKKLGDGSIKVTVEGGVDKD